MFARTRRQAPGPPPRRALAAGIAILLAIVAGSLAGDLRAGDDASSKEEGDLVAFVPAGPRGEAAPGKALLYVVRPTSMGFAIKSFFFRDTEILGINRGSSYFFALLDPGTHVLWSKSENVDALELAVEAGRTYYVQQQVQMGGFRARTKLVVLDEEAGAKALAKCSKYGALTANGRARGAELARDHRKDADEDLARRAAEAAAKASGKPADAPQQER